MNDLNPIVRKLINTDSMSHQEWDVLLDEWDDSNRINWVHQSQDTTLLEFWCTKSIPDRAIERLTAKYGHEIWEHPTQRTGSIFNTLIMHVCATDGRTEFNDSRLQTIIQTFGEQRLARALKELPHEFAKNTGIGAGSPFYLLAMAHGKTLQQSVRLLLQRNPDLLTLNDNGHNAATVLSKTSSGFQVYMESGGSLFAPTGPENKPLWQWLFHSKIYHDLLKRTLGSALLRLNAHTSPDEKDIVLSEEDWEKLKQQKTQILTEITQLEFEQNLQKDWKEAIKSNKSWRKWTNAEGANVMHWMALKQGETFVKSAAQRKINAGMISSTDSRGRDNLPYFIAGFGTIFSNLSWRKERKFSDEVLPEFFKTYTHLINPNPSKGVVPTFIDAHENEFFKHKIGFNGSNNSGHTVLHKWLSERPSVLFNGLTEDHWRRMVHNPDLHERVNELFSAQARYLGCTHFTQSMSTNEKIMFSVLHFNYAFLSGLSSETQGQFRALLKEIFASEDNTLDATTLETLTARMQKGTYYAWKSEGEELQSWLSKQTLLKQIAQQPEAAIEEPVRKRRM